MNMSIWILNAPPFQESIFVYDNVLDLKLSAPDGDSMKELCALEDIKMSCHDGAHIESLGS